MASLVKAKDGEAAEQVAAKMLRKEGLKILHRNYRAPRGEIDIIADDQGTLVFAEVRLRTHTNFGRPDETITWRKQQSIVRAAEHYLATEQDQNQHESQPCRFDAICLSPADDKRGNYTMEWLRDAFRLDNN